MLTSKSRVICPGRSLRPLIAYPLRNSRLACGYVQAASHRVDMSALCRSLSSIFPIRKTRSVFRQSCSVPTGWPRRRSMLLTACWVLALLLLLPTTLSKIAGLHAQHQILPETNPDLAPSGIFVAAKPLALEPKYRQLCHVIEPSGSARFRPLKMSPEPILKRTSYPHAEVVGMRLFFLRPSVPFIRPLHLATLSVLTHPITSFCIPVRTSPNTRHERLPSGFMNLTGKQMTTESTSKRAKAIRRFGYKQTLNTTED